MSEDIKLEVIKKTQELLSKHIKKPPLTEKLLRKPPFRFLHDIVTAVMKESNFLEGVFTPEELNSENIKDRESKIAFLEKLIAAVKVASGSSISARPSKIVAGLEVNKTHELLQAIARALEPEVNNSKPVDQAVNLKKKRSTDSKQSGKHESPRGGKSPVTNDKVQRRGSRQKTEIIESNSRKQKSKKETTPGTPLTSEEKKEKKNEETKKEKREKSEIKSKRKVSSVEEAQKVDNVMTPAEASNLDEKKNEEKAEVEVSTVMNGIHSQKALEESPPPDEPSAVEKRKDETPVGSVTKINEEVDQKEEKVAVEVTEKTVHKRPSSARVKDRAPSSKPLVQDEKKPVKSKKSEVNEPEVMAVLGSVPEAPTIQQPTKIVRPPTAKRPPSARPGAPRLRDRGEVPQVDANNSSGSENKPIPVIVDTSSNQDEDQENLVVVETQPNEFQQEQVIPETAEEEEVKEGEEGALVAQILETKKELEDTSHLPWVATQQQKNVEIEWEGGRRHKREAWQKEVEEIREGIQALTRATNPLGKLFDFLQEDVDSMQRELQTSAATNAQLHQQILHERRITEESLETLRRQLAEVESLIEAEEEAVRSLKANILANDKRIMSLITRTSPS